MAAIHDGILNHTPPSPGRSNPDLPGGFEAIISKALAKDRNNRYQSASEIQLDLRRLGLAAPGPSCAKNTRFQHAGSLYRLKVLHIKVPPLRDRREDIPMIAHAFLQKLNAANKLKKYCAPGVLDLLAAQNFPGNVRELQNAIERAFFLSKGNVIQDVLLESQTVAVSQDEVQSWFKDLSEGRKDFWSTIHKKYKRRDITREKIMALVDLGLRSTGGCYQTLATKFHMKRKEYRRLMDFLRRNHCLLDFRPYRRAASVEADTEP